MTRVLFIILIVRYQVIRLSSLTSGKIELGNIHLKRSFFSFFIAKALFGQSDRCSVNSQFFDIFYLGFLVISRSTSWSVFNRIFSVYTWGNRWCKKFKVAKSVLLRHSN